MGKLSRAQRLRAAQPAAQDKGWCDCCLDYLHDTGNSAVADAMIEAYSEMRTGFQLDRMYNHDEAIEWVESEASRTLQALKSSGEQYRRDGEIEYGGGASSEEEYNAWIAREEARRLEVSA